ncbi:MAG: nuclear transport factor 2 family protein [bacterium JZ-2024 1]
MNHFFRPLFEAIHRMDADRFISFLTEDATFRFANMPALTGRDAIRAGVVAFFESFTSLSHRLTGTWVCGDTAIMEGEVTYARKDGSRVTLPCADFFTPSLGEVAPEQEGSETEHKGRPSSGAYLP